VTRLVNGNGAGLDSPARRGTYAYAIGLARSRKSFVPVSSGLRGGPLMHTRFTLA